MKTYEKVTLATLNQGAAQELFDSNFQRLLDDIADPNKAPTKARTLTLKVTVKPDEQREGATTEVAVSLALPPPKPHTSSVVLDGNMGGKVSAHVSKLVPQELPSNVTELRQEAK